MNRARPTGRRKKPRPCRDDSVGNREPQGWLGLMRLRTLLYFYARRLRVHAMQELLAGIGVAVAVALVFAVTVANGSITDSASAVVRTVVGPADLQLHARGPSGFDERILPRVERMPGVEQAAPLLEQSATVIGSHGHEATVDVAGADLGLATLDGLAHTLPVGALSPGGIGLSQTAAEELRLPAYKPNTAPVEVTLRLRGKAVRVKVTAILGRETAGALAQAPVAVMPLSELQRLADLPGRVSRILVQSRPGHDAEVQRQLRRIAAARLTVAPANQDISLLRQALRPSNQASDLFAGLSALLGFLFAFNALLLTVPERREAIADLRLDGAPNKAIVQMVLFEALFLGLVASAVGLVGGCVLSTGLLHQSPGYLTKAFTLGTSTTIGVRPVLFSLAAGLSATCLASLVPLGDLRAGRPLDAVFSEQEKTVPGGPLASRRWFATGTLGMIGLATVVFALFPSGAILACILLALATMLALPVVLGLVLHGAGMLSRRRPRMTVLPLALASLRATGLRSLALAATGAVALFGSVALGSSRDDLLRGIDQYTANYAGSSDIWLVNPHDNQATDSFPTRGAAARIEQLPGVAGVQRFQGSFLDMGDRRLWVIAWPTSTRPGLLNGQIIHGSQENAARRLRAGSSITVSDQIAAEHHVGVGDTLTLPTPTGPASFTIAATTTNFGWSPGAILISAREYARAWSTTAPSALGIDLEPGANLPAVTGAITRTLGPGSGLEVLTADARETTIDRSASEGLAQLAEIAGLLVAAAILAMAAAIGSSIWQRRRALAELRLEGARDHQVRLVLLTESALMLIAGCVTGAVAGIYGQAVIDGYLKHVTGFPVAGVATGQRPIEIFVLVIAAVLLIVSLPGWFASRVPATLALNE
jgi:putative ABC transport system permease protein